MDLIYRYDPYLPVEVFSAKDSDAAIRNLCDGNRRLTSLVSKMQQATLGETSNSEIIVPFCPMSLGIPLYAGAVASQAPFALVLGCSDARAPVESIFDQSFNDLFVIRIAGNVLGTECLGSVDFAVRAFAQSLKLVVVLGHTGCGAVGAAVETYMSPNDYAAITLTHSLRSLVDRIMVAVRGGAHALQEVCGHEIIKHPNYKDALKEVSVFLNSAVTAFDLSREIASLGNKEMRVVYGVYDLATLFVSSVPNDAPTEPGFAPAPQQDEVAALAKKLAQAVVDKGTLGA